MTFCCHPEFISGSYYSQRFTKYCQNRFFGRCPQNDIKLFCRKYPVYKFALLDSTLPKIRQNDKKDLVILSVAKYLFCEAKGSPQEPSSFLSCWGTRYSFPSCKNIHRMFLLRQSLIGKKRKNNGYVKIINMNKTLAYFNSKTLRLADCRRAKR